MKDPDEYLSELSKWVSSDSLLIIDKNGKLNRIYCPFEVIPFVKTGDLIIGKEYIVTAVKVSNELLNVYRIGEKYYLGDCFIILAPYN